MISSITLILASINKYKVINQLNNSWNQFIRKKIFSTYHKTMDFMTAKKRRVLELKKNNPLNLFHMIDSNFVTKKLLSQAIQIIINLKFQRSTI